MKVKDVVEDVEKVEIWETTFLYIKPQGDLATYIGSCEGVEWTFLNGNGDVFEKSTDAQISSS